MEATEVEDLLVNLNRMHSNHCSAFVLYHEFSHACAAELLRAAALHHMNLPAAMPAASLMLLQVVVAACEKYPGKFDVAAKVIKEASLCVVQLEHACHCPYSTNFQPLTRRAACGR